MAYLKSQIVSAQVDFYAVFHQFYDSVASRRATKQHARSCDLPLIFFEFDLPKAALLRLYNLRFVLLYFHFHNIGRKHLKPRFRKRY